MDSNLWHNYWNCFLILLVLDLGICCASPLPAAAGDGSGGGKSDPLRLVSSVPAEGQAQVAVDSSIQLLFNKNVVNMTVNEGNQQCFSLRTAQGAVVPIEVIMADDQISPELRREIQIHPLQPLQAGSSYILLVDSRLQAKSGAGLEEAIQIAFKTAAGLTGSSEPAEISTKDEAVPTLSLDQAERLPAGASTDEATNSSDATATLLEPALIEAGASAKTEGTDIAQSDQGDAAEAAQEDAAQSGKAGSTQTLSGILLPVLGVLLLGVALGLLIRKKRK
jgi:hypothetical protein